MKKWIYLLLFISSSGFLSAALSFHSELQKNSALQAQTSFLSSRVDSIRRQEGAILDAKAVYSIRNTTIKDKTINWYAPDIIGLENVSFINDKFVNVSTSTCNAQLFIGGG